MVFDLCQALLRQLPIYKHFDQVNEEIIILSNFENMGHKTANMILSQPTFLEQEQNNKSKKVDIAIVRTLEDVNSLTSEI